MKSTKSWPLVTLGKLIFPIEILVDWLCELVSFRFGSPRLLRARLPKEFIKPANVFVDLALTTPDPLDNFVKEPFNLLPITNSLLGFSPVIANWLSLTSDTPFA